MRDKHYSIKPIRMAEETWKKLRGLRKDSGLTWNLFLLDLTSQYGKSIQHNKSKTKGRNKINKV